MNFCSPFDRDMAASGPPAVFVRSPEQEWRVEPDLSRDGWERLGRREEPLVPQRSPAHVLVRDRATGFVSWLYVTSTDLLLDHPRLDHRVYDDADTAGLALEALGPCPVVARL